MRHIKIEPGDYVEHAVVYTERGFRAADAILNPQEASDETNQYYRWNQNQIAATAEGATKS